MIFYSFNNNCLRVREREKERKKKKKRGGGRENKIICNVLAEKV